jgi:hypothetical protein
MAHVVTLDLPTDLATRAEAFAARTHQRLEDVLLEGLSRGASEMLVASLSDEEVLALALSKPQLEEAEERDLSDLLARQREGTLDAEEIKRLKELMHSYQASWVRKTKAIGETFKRGLRHPQLVPRTAQDDE